MTSTKRLPGGAHATYGIIPIQCGFTAECERHSTMRSRPAYCEYGAWPPPVHTISAGSKSTWRKRMGTVPTGLLRVRFVTNTAYGRLIWVGGQDVHVSATSAWNAVRPAQRACVKRNGNGLRPWCARCTQTLES